MQRVTAEAVEPSELRAGDERGGARKLHADQVSGSRMISTRQVIRSKPPGCRRKSSSLITCTPSAAHLVRMLNRGDPRRAVSAAARRLGKTRSFTETSAGLLNHRRTSRFHPYGW